MPTLIGEKHSGNITTRVGKNGILLREQSHHYTVQADSEWQDRAEIIFNTAGLPRYGQVYIGGLCVASINADRHPDDATRWDVVVTGSTEVEEDQQSKNERGGSTSSNPIDWIPIASVKFEPYEEVLRKDINGKRWVNSAKKPFETGLSIQRRVAMVQFSQFEPLSTTLDDLMNRSDTVNSIVYKGKAIKTLRLNVENATVGTYSGFRCWRVDYSMRYKADNWIIKQLDVGWGYITDGNIPYADGLYIRFETDDAEPESFLGSLNGTGGKMPDQNTDEPEILEFEAYEAIDFNDFLKVLFT